MQKPFPSNGIRALSNSLTGEALPFAGVTVRARIGVVMTQVDMVQRYRNQGSKAVETVYTFPLPDKAVLLSFKARIGKNVIDGMIEKKEAAADRYERAIENGRSAAMVEMAGEGLLTAHLGNLPAGENAEIAVTWVEFNAWRDGELRWSLPTCIAPRFGKSPFEPQNEPITDRSVRHDAEICIAIAPELSDADISTSGHRLTRREKSGTVTLETGRRNTVAMDRDILVNIRSRRDISMLRMGRANGATAALLSFVPRWKAPGKGGRSIKIVLDCSYSMSGASIETARQAVETLLGKIGKKDDFNLIRFGSRAQAVFPAQAPGTKENRVLAERCIAQLAADMGGTEIAGALDLAYRSKAQSERPGTVILVTDGQVHDDGAIVAAAAASRHRIFCIGIGTAINHGLLSAIAEESGGSAEFISPGEDVGKAILRQFDRIRACCDLAPTIDWPGKPVAVTAPPINAYSGDAIHAVAIYDKTPKGEVSFHCPDGNGRQFAASFAFSGTEIEAGADELVRAAAGRILDERIRRFDMTADPESRSKTSADGEKLALRFGLLSPWTSYVLVCKSGKKIKTKPVLHKVPQMAPAGWQMFAGIGRQSAPMPMMGNGAVSSCLRSAAAPRAAIAFGMAAGGHDMARLGMPQFIDDSACEICPSDFASDTLPFIPTPVHQEATDTDRATEAFLIALDLALAAGQKIDSISALKMLASPDWLIRLVMDRIAEGKAERKAVRMTLLEAAAAHPAHFSMAGNARLQMAA